MRCYEREVLAQQSLHAGADKCMSIGLCGVAAGKLLQMNVGCKYILLGGGCKYILLGGARCGMIADQGYGNQCSVN